MHFFSDNGRLADSKVVPDSHISQLQKWIPGKAFKLLYRATRDGMTPKAFHNKCNNQGPTLTVGRDATTGTIYGGLSEFICR